MKRARAMILFVFTLAACALLVQQILRQPQPSRRTQAPTIAPQCDQNLWRYVYNPGRLHVLNPCVSVTGTVEKINKEADGDYHIRFRLDQQFELLLNEKNISRQEGDLVLETICQGRVRQADAVDACSSYNGVYFTPALGQRYLVWGAAVYDADHGWNELHPVTSMQPIE
jgi:hypothetical protein